MALTDPYASAADYHARYPNTSTANDIELENQLLAVSRYIDQRCGRWFALDASDTTRVYVVPKTSRKLSIIEISAEPTTIKVDTDGDGSFSDETALGVAEYEMRADGDVNALEGPEARPYNEIVLTDQATTVTQFVRGQRVEVVGLHGWPAVPYPIRSATIELCAIWLVQSPRAQSTVDDFGRAIRLSSRAQSLVDELVQMYRRGVVA